MFKKIPVKVIYTWARYFVKNPMFFSYFVANFYNPVFSVNARIQDQASLLLKIKSGKSIIRLGDGDMGIMHGKGIFHQDPNVSLAKDLFKIVRDYSAESPYVLCVPKFINKTNSELRKSKNFLCWFPFKVEFLTSFNLEMEYADAHMFYYLQNTKEIFNNFIKGRDVVYVSNLDIIQKIKKSDLHGPKNIYYETPAYGAYDSKDRIIKELKYLLHPGIILVISCGCLSRILAEHFSKEGYQSFDIGTGIASYLEDKDYGYMV
jgi:hypothetical protein